MQRRVRAGLRSASACMPDCARLSRSRTEQHDSYIVRRIGYSLLSLFLLSLTIFLFVRVTGDPAMLLVEPGASQADIDAMRERFGLDQPIWVQYWSFMASLVARRPRPVVLLPHAGARALPLAPAELAAAGARRPWPSRC